MGSSRHGRRGRCGRQAAITLVALKLAGCDGAPEPQTFDVIVQVESDPGAALPGVEVQRQGKLQGQTGEDGSLSLSLAGRPGDSVQLEVRCPEGHEQPDAPLSVALRALSEGSPTPRYEVRCPPLLRSVVVAIRAENGANVPVLYRGQPVARTDAEGAAHLVLKVAPDETVALTLDTSGPEHADLVGDSPELKFTMPTRDEVTVLEYAFERKAKKRRAPKQPDRPVDLSKQPAR